MGNEDATCVWYKKCDDSIAILYADSDYRGYSKSLGEGSYTQAELAMYGISAKDISSLKVTKASRLHSMRMLISLVIQRVGQQTLLLLVGIGTIRLVRCESNQW